MPVMPIKELGKAGVVKDTSPANLPENVFTDALNVRFRNNSIETILGETTFKDVTGVSPEYGIHWPRPDTAYSVFANDGTVIAVPITGSNVTLLNSGDPAYANSRWNFDTFGGGYSIILNNGNSTPLYCLVDHPSADLTLQAFPGWNYDSNVVTAAVVRPFGYSLVAANLVINGVKAPVTLRISVQAPIGGFPQIWKPGLTTDTADEFEINSKSPIVDLLELRGNMYVYTQESVHVLTLTNGIAQVRPYLRNNGTLNQGCVVEFEGNHVSFDGNDLYIHNGSGRAESVLLDKNRDFLLGDINRSYESSVFLHHNRRFREIWICYVSTGTEQSRCNKALIFNYSTGSTTFRTLPNVVSMFQSPAAGASTFQSSKRISIGCIGAAKTLEFDNTYQMYNGSTFVDFNSYVRRDKLSTDLFGDTFITGITPVLSVADNTTVVNFHLCTQNVFDATPDFTNTSGRDLFTIDPRNTRYGYKVDPRTVGRFVNMKIECDKYWRLDAMALDVSQVNRR